MPGPLPISPDTALKLSRFLGIPVEHLMHMPRHILLQKLAEMAAKEQAEPDKPGHKDDAR
jgi:plasmid maintenance system antidote protein VapI